jgi:aryl-alcohol dehydrogenase-like predicted oxidoreductase
MNKRLYGKTGKYVSELGFGAWQLGNLNAGEWGDSDQDPIRLVHAALDAGVNFFDTAPNYGGGASTDFLGKALKGKRDQAVINSKFGHSKSGTSFAVSDLGPSVEDSLKRLNTDYLDSLLLHNPDYSLCDGTHPIHEELENLQKEGKILSYGASLDESKPILQMVRSSHASAVMPLYNIFFQESADAFAEAAAADYAIIVKVPLDSGWLTGKYGSDSNFSDIRSRWPEHVIRQRAELTEELQDVLGADFSLHQAALSFILASPEVSTVIPGIKNEEQLKSNIQAAATVLPEPLIDDIREFYNKKLRNNPLPW